MPGGLALLTRDDSTCARSVRRRTTAKTSGCCPMNRSIRSACWAVRCRRRRCDVRTAICRAAPPTTCIGWDVISNAPKARCDCIAACSATCPARAPATTPATLDTLARLLVSQERLTARRARRATVDGARAVEQELWQVLFDPESPDGLAKVLGNVGRTAELVRERLSADAWRILESLTRTPEVPWRAHAIGDAVKLLNTMIQNLSAITGMIQENMTRGYGWRLLDMGRRIERTRYAARLIRGITTHGEPAESGVLNLLLELVDSTMTYRSRYKAIPQLPAVLDLVMADESNPRSLIFQISEIEEHLERDAARTGVGPISAAQKIVISLLAELRLVRREEAVDRAQPRRKAYASRSRVDAIGVGRRRTLRRDRRHVLQSLAGTADIGFGPPRYARRDLRHQSRHDLRLRATGQRLASAVAAGAARIAAAEAAVQPPDRRTGAGDAQDAQRFLRQRDHVSDGAGAARATDDSQRVARRSAAGRRGVAESGPVMGRGRRCARSAEEQGRTRRQSVRVRIAVHRRRRRRVRVRASERSSRANRFSRR